MVMLLKEVCDEVILVLKKLIKKRNYRHKPIGKSDPF